MYENRESVMIGMTRNTIPMLERLYWPLRVVMVQVRPRNLRHRITIEQVTEQTDVNGPITDTWSHIPSRWASVEPLEGRELFEAHQVNAEVSHRVPLRWLAGREVWEQNLHDRFYTQPGGAAPGIDALCHEEV
jgi:Phage head-tail joining protein